MEKKKIRFTTTRIIMLGFLLGVILGTILLALPVSSADGKPVNILDALFVATSAICVTGLSTVVTATQWSLFGQFVLLFLIQFGGLGIVTVMTFMLLLLRRRISLSERLLIQEAYNLDTLGGLVRVTKSIVKGTLIVEGIGAVLFFFCFVGDYGGMAVWYAVFHSVSAFCNAGIDLVGDSGFVVFRTNIPMNLIAMALIVTGGIGFPVWWDVIDRLKRIREKEIPLRQFWRRLSLHTKLAVTMTVTLIVTGAVLYFVFEYGNPDTIGGLSFGKKVMASFFQSITTRTAGFQTVPQENLTQASGFLTLILMMIGGSPSSTAGGIKTVTFFVLVLSVISLIRGKKDIEIYGRRLSAFYVRKALAIFSVSFSCMIVATLLLCATQGWTVMEALYEAGSALATVGLSCGKTGDLNNVGKVIITCCMYLGRIGPITLALSLQSSGKRNNRELPEGRILIG